MKPDNVNQERSRAKPARAERWPALLVVLAFLAAAVPLIVTQHDRGRGRFDQINYHEPTVLRFAEQLPTPDVSDYLSATTPGYHLVLAVVARVVSPSPIVLQLVGAMFTVGLLWVLTRWLTPRVGGSAAAAMGGGLAASLYVFSAGVYLLPDNAGWFGVLGVLLIALRPRFDARTLVAGGGVLLALVLTRQSHLWGAGVLWASAWLGANFLPYSGVRGEVGALFGGGISRARRLALAVLSTLPAFLAIAWFARMWGGLTVPIYHDYMQGVNPATPAIILGQLAVIGAFHVGYWIGPAWRLVRTKPAMLAFAVVGGLALAVIPETTYSVEAGRYSGLWNISAKFPDLLGRTNLLVVLLSMGGAVAVASWLGGMSPRNRWVMLAALVGFSAALSLNLNAWQRYHEPMLLMSAALMSALVVCREREERGPDAVGSAALPREPARSVHRLSRVFGPLALAVLLGGVTVVKERSEAPVTTPIERQESVERPLKELWPSRWERVERLAED